MIEAEQFVEAARENGYEWYAGVPCSFLTPFINYVINDDKLNFISSANEGDALATAAGAAIGGKRAVVMMQNSGLGNAVSPLTSLAWVFRIPMLLICTHRGAPGLKDEPQHELMGQITSDLFETMQVPWETFPSVASDIEPALQRARAYMEKESRPYAFIMAKGTVAPHALRDQSAPGHGGRMTRRRRFYRNNDAEKPARNAALQRIAKLTPSSGSILVATTGFTGRELYAIEDRANHLYMVGSMGCASSWGLGLSLARPDLEVIVIEGDGAALMRMGNLATVGAYGQRNLIHIVLDNGVHDSTGAQATVSGGVAFAGIAEACGYGTAFEGDDLSLLNALFSEIPESGPRFGHLKIRAGTISDLPRPDITPQQVVQRLMTNIGASF